MVNPTPRVSQATLAPLLKRAAFVPVIANHLDSVVPQVQALIEGGVDVVEVALRSPKALEAIAQLKKTYPKLIVGAATIMTEKEMDDAISAGAEFGASPMFDSRLIQHAKIRGFTYLPCVSDLAQINAAAQAGFNTLKLFPMDAMGDGEDGEKFLRGNSSMLNKLNVTLYTSCLETQPNNIEKYLKHDRVICTASGWSVPSDLVIQRNWQAITKIAQRDKLRVERVINQKECPPCLSLSLGRQCLNHHGFKLGLAFLTGVFTATMLQSLRKK